MIEKTLVILKPDSINRGLSGEILHRFERKGLKIVAMKMTHLDDEILNEHYSHLADKPFFPTIANFMKSAPSVLLVLEGLNAVEVVRTLAGPTHGGKAAAGTIRGDYSISVQANVMHASDSSEAAADEVKRFFDDNEIFEWDKIDFQTIYSEDERE